MSQINILVNAARAVAQSTSSAVGVSAANANLVAVAGALSGMQLSGFEAFDPRMFEVVPAAEEGSGLLGTEIPNAMPTAVSSGPHQGGDTPFAGLVETDARLDFQDFFFSAPLPSLTSSTILPGFEEQVMVPLEPKSDANNTGIDQPSNIVSEMKEASLALKDGIELNAGDALSGEAGGGNVFSDSMQGVKGGISQASSKASSSINYASPSASPQSFSDLSSGFFSSVTNTDAPLNSALLSDFGSDPVLEPNGFVYQSFGSGNVVQGSPFADTLFGSLAGNDLLIGGAGNDTYYVYTASTQMKEALMGGLQDVAYIGVDNFVGISGIEQVRALETDAYSAKALTSDPYSDGLDSGWRINGDNTDQILVGLYGADILNGGGGSDLLIGGAGNDVYFYSGTETILENAGEGRDTIQTNADLILGANIEIGITLSNSSDVSITGNALDNILIGNASANNLSGGAGNDTLVSLGGEDMLTGGTGADTFVLNGQDNFLGEITDFQSSLDRISLMVSDPSITLSMAPEDGFTGVAGQLWAVGGAVMIDWNGNAQLDSILLLNETPLLSDFMLIDQNQYQYF
jgi:Ca2+-binding RTX toxin-like protein